MIVLERAEHLWRATVEGQRAARWIRRAPKASRCPRDPDSVSVEVVQTRSPSRRFSGGLSGSSPRSSSVGRTSRGVTPAVPIARPALVSEQEFLSLPETMDRIELLDGEVIVSPSPSVWYRELPTRLVQMLRHWNSQNEPEAFVGQAPFDVRFGDGRILQPDTFLLLSGLSLEHEGPIEKIPDLCIEVLDQQSLRWLDPATGLRRGRGPRALAGRAGRSDRAMARSGPERA